MGEDRNSFRKDQRRKGKLGSMMGRCANPEVLTFSKGVERD